MEVLILTSTILHSVRILPLFLVPTCVTWLDKFPFSIPNPVIRSHVLFGLFCLLSFQLIPYLGEERAGDVASISAIGAAGLSLACSTSSKRRTRDTPKWQFIGVSIFLVTFTVLPSLFGAYWLAVFVSIVNLVGLAVNAQGFLSRRCKSWDGRKDERTGPSLAAKFEDGTSNPPLIVEWSSSSELSTRSVHEWDSILLHRPKTYYDPSSVPLPIKRGVYYLDGNPAETYADLTRLRWSPDRSIAILQHDAHWRLESMWGQRILSSVLGTLSIPPPEVIFHLNERGRMSHTLFGIHISGLLSWSVDVLNSMVIRRKSSEHTYEARCVLEKKDMCLEETVHTESSKFREERVEGRLVNESHTIPLFPRIAGSAGNRASHLLCSRRRRTRSSLPTSAIPTEREWFFNVIRLHDTGKVRQAYMLCASLGEEQEEAFRTVVTDATRSFPPSTSAPRLCAAAYRAMRGRRNVSESEVSEGRLKCGLPACGLDFALKLTEARLAHNMDGETEPQTTEPAFLRPYAARLSFFLLGCFAMLLLDSDPSFSFSPSSSSSGRHVSTDVIVAGCIVGMTVCRLVSLGCKSVLCWEGGTPLLDFISMMAFLAGPNGDAYTFSSGTGGLGLQFYSFVTFARCASMCMYANVFWRESFERVPSLLAWSLSATGVGVSACLIYFFPTFQARVAAYIVSFLIPSFLLIRSEDETWAVRMRVCAPGMGGRRPSNARQILFEPTTVTILVVVFANLVSFLSGRREYESFMMSNPIYERIGFNNLCVYMDMHPYSSLSGALLFVNVITMLLHLSMQGTVVSCMLIGICPCFLLIFLVSPAADLFAHAVLGYGTILIHTSYVAWNSGSKATSAFVLLYFCLVFVAFGTDFPLPLPIVWTGYVVDRLIALFFLWRLVSELAGKRAKMYYLQFTKDVLVDPVPVP